MALNDGQQAVALNLTLREARALYADAPDGRVDSLERRRLRDPAELSAQGARLSLEIGALEQARANIDVAGDLLRTAERGAQRIEELLDRLRRVAVEAAKDERSDFERRLLDARFQEAVRALDRAAASTRFDGQPLVDAAFARLVPVGTTALTGVETLDGGTGTFTAATAISGTGARNLRLTDVPLATARTVVNNGDTFPEVRRFDLAIAANTAATMGTVALSNVRVATEGGATTAVAFTGKLSAFPAVTVTPTGGGNVQLNATTITTLTLAATQPALAGNALLDVTESFRATVPAPTGHTGTAAFLGRQVTPLAFRVGTGTQPSADEVAVNLGGLTPGALALQDVRLTDQRRAERAERLVAEASAQLQRTLGSVTGGRQRLDEADDAAEQQRDGLIAAREAIRGPARQTPLAESLVADIVEQLDIGVGRLDNRLPDRVYAPLFPNNA